MVLTATGEKRMVSFTYPDSRVSFKVVAVRRPGASSPGSAQLSSHDPSYSQLSGQIQQHPDCASNPAPARVAFTELSSSCPNLD